MNAREFITQLQGQNPDSTVLLLTNDEFYEVSTIATPVADATVIVLTPEPSAAPASDAIKAMPNTVGMLQGRTGDEPAQGTAQETPQDVTAGADAAPALETEAPKDTAISDTPSGA